LRRAVEPDQHRRPECVSVRKIATQFGEVFGVAPIFAGEERADCLFVNCDHAADLLGNPVVPINPMVRWVAEWVKSRKPLYGKPSKFDVRSGVF
jgi:hypothetical protein